MLPSALLCDRIKTFRPYPLMNAFIWRFVAATLGALSIAATVQGAVITYAITDAGDFVTPSDFTASDTFAGPGFVGMFFGGKFSHFFGFEYYGGVFSMSELEVNTSALLRSRINSATLSYQLLDGYSAPAGNVSQSVTITSFNADGTLAYNTAPPSNNGTATFTSYAKSSNSVDLTSLVSNSVNSGRSWLGLFFTPNGPGDNYQWTYSSAFFGRTADSPNIRLTVDFTPVPEPSTLVLGIGLGLGLAAIGRRALVRRFLA